MGWGFRKRIGFGKLFHLNISRSGISLTVGIPGLSFTIGRNGVTRNMSIPGTGLYRRDRIGGKHRD